MVDKPILTSAKPEAQPKRLSLYDFIDQNQKLLTAIAAFIAMTAFLIQATAGDSEWSKLIPGIPLFGALLLILELWLRIPAEGAQKSFRLFGFEMVVLGLGASLTWMWYQKFPTAWAFVAGLLMVVLFALVVSLVALLGCVPFGWALKRYRHRPLTRRENRMIMFGAMIVSMVLVVGGVHWANHHLKNTEPQTSTPIQSTPPNR